MKKVFRLEDLDCANCAAKMERAIAKIDGVVSVNISFMSQRMSIEADDERFEEIMDQAAKACKKSGTRLPYHTVIREAIHEKFPE